VTRKNKEKPQRDARSANDFASTTPEVKIIGGTFRGRQLAYHGDPVVRPMKHRTREAIFNLVSTECAGRHAIDLFAGTGALGLEALSRGAARATLVEKHVPSARIVEQNIRTLGVEDKATLLTTSAFLWAKRDLPALDNLATEPFLVFCSPPYSFFNDRQPEMLDLVERIKSSAPPGSILIVEAEEGFDLQIFRGANGEEEQWDIRRYLPAIVGLWRSPAPQVD